MSFVVIDTSIVLPGLIGIPSEMDKPQCVRGRAFFDWLAERSIQAAITAPTLAELMLHRSGPLAANALLIIKSRLRVLPFDERAALLLGQLHQMRMADSEIQRLAKQTNQTKRMLRFDLQVLAAAKAHGATSVYSEDEGQRALAAGFIPANPIPAEVQAQQSLFPTSGATLT
jgi:predicted nucleic acid-binding protein